LEAGKGDNFTSVMIAILDMFGSSGGVGRCTKEMLRQFETEGVSTTLCGQSHVVDSFRAHNQQMPNVHLANLERPKLSLRSLKIRMARKYSNSDPSRLANVLLQETISATSARNGAAVLPILVNYPQIIAPATSEAPFCLFLHDLNWRLYPGNFDAPDLTDENCRGWVKRATKVITNSECTRDEVIEHYGCASDKVVAAPLAPFEGGISNDIGSSKYLADLGLVVGRFYLFPGVWGLHKGHGVLTEAIEAAPAANPVVVTCGMPRDGINGVPKAVAALRNSLVGRWDKLIERKKLVVVGGVSEAKMQALRNGCRAYVVPSLYEGFGFPMVEAIYQFRPAIVSDIKAHQEILNRYPKYQLATRFPSGSSAALAAELNRGVDEPGPAPGDWKKHVEATWSWKHTVQKILMALTNKTEVTR
jgi:glycosyltransferase involved in cell wall biosynthesis